MYSRLDSPVPMRTRATHVVRAATHRQTTTHRLRTAVEAAVDIARTAMGGACTAALAVGTRSSVAAVGRVNGSWKHGDHTSGQCANRDAKCPMTWHWLREDSRELVE